MANSFDNGLRESFIKELKEVLELNDPEKFTVEHVIDQWVKPPKYKIFYQYLCNAGVPDALQIMLHHMFFNQIRASDMNYTFRSRFGSVYDSSSKIRELKQELHKLEKNNEETKQLIIRLANMAYISPKFGEEMSVPSSTSSDSE